MDIGCYLIYTSRLIFGEEPTRVVATIERDPEMGTDILTSGILHFPSGQSIFTCSTQVAPYQRVQIIGTKGRIEIPIPFNAPPISRAGFSSMTEAIFPVEAQILEFAVCDQYTIQGDLFSQSIREGTEQLSRWRVRSGTWGH